MNTLPVYLPNRRLDFTETGDVLDPNTGASVGRWTAESSNPAEQNCLIFRESSGARQAIKAQYSFNADNQLVVSLATKDGTVEKNSKAVFNGSIQIDDEHDVIYTLADAPASDLAQVVVLYGDLAFDGPTRLALRLTGGGKATITSKASAPLSTERNTNVDLAGHDLLVFHAATTNHFGDKGDSRDASISLAGQWKLLPQGISFECSTGGDLTNPDLVLSLKGRSKAVAAGLEFHLDEGKAEALFTIEGQHTFDAGTASWSLAVGYSQLADPAKRIKASAKGSITHRSAGGNLLTIGGTLSYDGGGKSGTLELAIAAEYTFAAGQIVFKANANWSNSHYQYDLQLSGEIKVRGGKLVFDVHYGSNNVASLTVNYTGGDSDFLKYFNVQLTRDAAGKVKATVDFSIKVTYINGVQVTEKAA